MNKKSFLVTSAALLCAGSVVTQADPTLQEYAIYIDTAVTDVFPPAAAVIPGVDYSGFNSVTGLGTLKISVMTAGPHELRAFFDHDLPAFFGDESGSAIGSPLLGQSWEIDEPGYGNNGESTPYIGDIYANFSTGSLDNLSYSGGSGTPTLLDDMSMAMGWSFTGPADLLFTLSTVDPGSGFRLMQSDGDSALFLSAELRLTDPGDPQVPEASAPVALLFGGLFGLAAWKYKSRRQ